MEKQNGSKSSEGFEKDKVTPMQVAFLVDRYLCDHGFSGTRSLFRSEASSLMSKSPARDVEKSLLTLDDILDEYICLKEKKVMVDQERARLEQEKSRVQNLLHGMQDVMNAYNASMVTPPPAIPAAVPSPAATPATTPAVSQTTALTPHQDNFRSSSSSSGLNTSNAIPVSLPRNKRIECGDFSTPSTSRSVTRKRKGPELSHRAPPVSRKTRNKTAIQTSATDGLGTDRFPQAHNAVSGLTSQTPSDMQISGHGSSSVAKCLFDKPVVSPPVTTTCPGTPQTRPHPQSDKPIVPQDLTTTNCTIVTKERITVTPLKQITSYTLERSRVITSSPAKPSKRDRVKGRLDFDDSDALTTADRVSASSSGSEQETDLVYLDFPNLDLLGENFSFSDILCDFDLGYEGAVDPCLQQPSIFPVDTVSGSSPGTGI